MTDHTTAPTHTPRQHNASGGVLTKPWLWWALAVVFFLATVVAVVIVNSTVLTAKEPVERYFAALHDGDGARALAISSAHLQGHEPAENPEGVSTALLDGEPLSAAVAAIEDVEFDVVADGDEGVQIPESLRNDEVTQRVVIARFTIDGDEQETRFVVDLTGKDWLVFNHWDMHPLPLPQLTVTTAEDTDFSADTTADETIAEINGTPAPLAGDGTRVAVFPPAQVTVDYHETYIEAAEPVTTLVSDVLTEENPRVQVDLALTDQVRQDILEEVRTSMTRCTEQQVLQPTGCPFGYATTNRVDAETIEWSIADDLQINYVTDGSGDGSENISQLEIDSLSATAVIELVEIDLASGQRLPTDYSEEFAMGADLSLTPTEVSVSPRWF